MFSVRICVGRCVDKGFYTYISGCLLYVFFLWYCSVSAWLRLNFMQNLIGGIEYLQIIEIPLPIYCTLHNSVFNTITCNSKMYELIFFHYWWKQVCVLRIAGQNICLLQQNWNPLMSSPCLSSSMYVNDGKGSKKSKI